MFDPARPVRVHRTFGDDPGLWTLTQDGEIVGFRDDLCIADVVFVFDTELQAAAKARPNERTVYAWAQGTLADLPEAEGAPVLFDGKVGAFVGPGGPLAACGWLSFRGKRVSGGALVRA